MKEERAWSESERRQQERRFELSLFLSQSLKAGIDSMKKKTPSLSLSVSPGRELSGAGEISSSHASPPDPAQGPDVIVSSRDRSWIHRRSIFGGGDAPPLGEVGVERIGVDVDDVCLFVVVDRVSRSIACFSRRVIVVAIRQVSCGLAPERTRNKLISWRRNCSETFLSY